MTISPKQGRDIQRSVHLATALVLLAYLYTPLNTNGVFDVMIRAIVIPLLILSGVVMWQMPRIRRWRRTWSERTIGMASEEHHDR